MQCNANLEKGVFLATCWETFVPADSCQSDLTVRLQGLVPDSLQLSRVPGDDLLSDVGYVDLFDDSGRLPVPVLEEIVDLDGELHDVAGGPEVVSLDGEDRLHTVVHLADCLPDAGQDGGRLQNVRLGLREMLRLLQPSMKNNVNIMQ